MAYRCLDPFLADMIGKMKVADRADTESGRQRCRDIDAFDREIGRFEQQCVAATGGRGPGRRDFE
jgi:hypothetical protein